MSVSLPLLESEFGSYERTYKTPKLLIKLRRTRAGEAKLLHDLYDRKNESLAYVSKLRTAARLRLSACPYCGLPTDYLTLDHYLPRSKRLFPHFSVLTANLVPCCMSCQHAKGEFYPQNASPVRSDSGSGMLHRKRIGKLKSARLGARRSPPEPERILHPYFDRIFFPETLSLVKVGNQHLLGSVPGSPRSKAVDFHVRRLNLIARTAIPISRKLTGLTTLFTALEIKTIDAAQRQVLAQLAGAYAEAGHAGTIPQLVFRILLRTPALLNQLVAQAQAAQPMLVPESEVVSIVVE